MGKDVEGNDGPIKGRKCWKCMRVTLALLFLGMAACIIALAVLLTQKDDVNDVAPDVTSTTHRPTDPEPARSASGRYRYGAVAADHVTCSQIGTDIMAGKGGSAVDAAIATLLCLGVQNSQSMGIGGGFLMTIYDSENNTVHSLVSREVAPLAATTDMYVNDSSLSTTGGLAIGVPAEIAGYGAAHGKFGKLPWATLFQPAIDLCANGLIVGKTLAGAIARSIDIIRKSEALGAIFLNPDGEPYEEGDTMYRPELAHTLNRIAKQGPEAFYTGGLSADIVADIQNNGGIVTAEDLEQYRPRWEDPVSTHLANGDYTLYGPPPPSSAVVLQYILNIVDGFQISSADLDTVEKRVLMTHRVAEAMKFGFAKRSHLGDQDFVNVTEWKTLLMSDDYANTTRFKIDDNGVLELEDYEPAFDIMEDSGTSHLSVYAADGSAVAVTSTINLVFGSKVRGNKTGIIFNNEMDDFSTPGTVNSFGVPASEANYIEPKKSPMSSMSPTIVLNKDSNVVLAVGASGGTRIITSVIQVILNNLWLGYNVSESLDASRFHHQLIPPELKLEDTFPEDIRSGLRQKGHKLDIQSATIAVSQVIRNVCNSDPETSNQGDGDPLCVHAASDVRKGGAPAGF